uniref:site-specific DNA-methyltransferase (adenine-specific) n=1 Tax=viral metagenome TaxID=1070528 RepID=A0A6C0E6Z6_9ZZZZ
MPTYTCDKCARVFKQKSGYTDHMAKKNDCAQTSLITHVIDKKVEETVKQVLRASQQKPEITKETLPAFFEDLHNLLWNKAGLNPERALEHMTFFFAYRLIEQQADVLNLPQECRWSFIASLNNENDLFETIKKGVSEFRKRPKTKAFFKPHEIQKADIVFEIVQQISRISLEILKETDTLGDIFEYMLGRGMSTMSDEGQYFTNRAICKLAFKLSYDIKKNLRREDGSLCTFADWFCGTGGFPAEYVKGVKANLPSVDWKKECGSVYCQDMNLSSVTTTLLNMLILTGIPFSGDKIRGSNSFSDPIITGTGAPFDGLTIDYCFMNPPYGGDKSKGKDYKFAYSKKVKTEDGTIKKFFVNKEIQSIGIEDDDKVSAGVQLAMATLADGGVCSIVLPQGFFFGASKKCVELRKKIAEEYKIWFIVDIASGAFANTGTKTSMMVFQKGSTTDKVAFIGLDEKLLVTATLAELRAKNYSLNYKQYLPQSMVEVEGFEMVKLGTLLKQKNYPKHPTEYGKESGKFRFHTGAESTKLYTDTPDIDDLVIIVNRTNGSGKSHIFLESKCSVAGQTITFSCRDDTTTRYVYYYLRSNIKVLEDGYVGANHKNLTIQYVNDMKIPLPSLERQQQIVEAIDGWAGLAQQEEVALKILEKQMMFQVKEMGRGQARVKLGEVSEIRNGKALTKEDLTGGDIPVIGGGVSPMGYHNTYNKEPYTVVLAQIGANAGNVSRYPVKSWITNNGMTIHPKGTSIINDDVLYYLLKNIQDDIKGFAEGTAQPKLSSTSVLSLEVQLPPLAEQQTLQSDFDEIRHKHAKIATYKAKAQEAIQRLIPGAA